MQHDRSWKDLAVFGGPPRFVRPLHVNRPNEANRQRLFARLEGMLDRRWFSDGVLVREFEAEIARITGTRHCVATCNGTLALEVAASAMGLTGEVIVPSFTFFATAQALRWLGLEPLYCDVDRGTHNIDPDHVKRLISPRTSAIMGVHLWGNPCDVDVLQDIADRHGLSLLFDAAHAFGCTHQGRAIGGFGAAEVFSFQATKFVNSGEGGAITTNDDALAERLRAARDLGFDDSDQVIGPGTNAKMSELSAAMGLTYLEHMDEFIQRNRDTLDRYREGLAGIPGIELFDIDGIRRGNAQFVVSIVDEKRSGISRDAILRTLRAEKILAKRYFHPGCHRLDPLYPGSDGAPGEPLPATEQLTRTVLVLPGGASIAADEVDGVCETLRLILTHGAEIQAALLDVEEPVRTPAAGSAAVHPVPTKRPRGKRR